MLTPRTVGFQEQKLLFTVAVYQLRNFSVNEDQHLPKKIEEEEEKKKERKNDTRTRPDGANKLGATVDSDHYPIDCRLTDINTCPRVAVSTPEITQYLLKRKCELVC